MQANATFNNFLFKRQLNLSRDHESSKVLMSETK